MKNPLKPDNLIAYVSFTCEICGLTSNLWINFKQKVYNEKLQKNEPLDFVKKSDSFRRVLKYIQRTSLFQILCYISIGVNAESMFTWNFKYYIQKITLFTFRYIVTKPHMSFY